MRALVFKVMLKVLPLDPILLLTVPFAKELFPTTNAPLKIGRKNWGEKIRIRYASKHARYRSAVIAGCLESSRQKNEKNILLMAKDSNAHLHCYEPHHNRERFIERECLTWCCSTLQILKVGEGVLQENVAFLIFYALI